jgi:hypothetical protein
VTTKAPEKGPNGGRAEGYEPLKEAVARAQARKCDPAVHAWIQRLWIKTGAIVKEIDVRHVRFAGSAGSTIMTVADLGRFFEGEDGGAKRLALELDECMCEHAVHFAGAVRYVLVAVGEAGQQLGEHPVKKKGGAQDGDDDAGLDVSERGTVALLLRHERDMFTHHLRAFAMVTEKLEASAARAEANSERFQASMPAIAESFAKLIEAIQKVGDMGVEQQIKLRKELVKVHATEKGVEVLMRFAPRLIQEVTKGTRFEGTGREIGAAPELERLFVSLMKDKERLGRIFAELKEDEQSSLLMLLESFPEPQKEIEARQIEGKVEGEGAAPGAPTPEGSG